MRRAVILIFIALAFGVVVSANWFLMVEPAQLSELTRDGWLDFASYFGNIMMPVVAVLSLAAFIVTLWQQQQQLTALKVDSKKTSLFRVIEKFERDFDKELGLYRFTNNVMSGPRGPDDAYELTNCLNYPDWRYFMPKNDMGERASHDPELTKTHEYDLWVALSLAAATLNQIRVCVEDHDQLSGDFSMTKYYSRKYYSAFRRLREKGYITDILEEPKPGSVEQ